MWARFLIAFRRSACGRLYAVVFGFALAFGLASEEEQLNRI